METTHFKMGSLRSFLLVEMAQIAQISIDWHVWPSVSVKLHLNKLIITLSPLPCFGFDRSEVTQLQTSSIEVVQNMTKQPFTKV